MRSGAAALAVAIGLSGLLVPAPAQAASAWESCENSAGDTISGCHRIGTWNLANPDYWPSASGGYGSEDAALTAACGDAGRPPGIESVATCRTYGAWAKRRSGVGQTINNADVDILGVQEVNDNTVWSSWDSTHHRNSTYRAEAYELIEGRGLTHVTGTGNGGSQLFYDADRYTLVSKGLLTEHDLMSDEDLWNIRGVTNGVGERFSWAKLRLKGESSTDPRNTVVVASIHIPSTSDKGFPNGHALATRIDYQRTLSKEVGVALARQACVTATCSGITISNPKVPVVVMGDFNGVYTQASPVSGPRAYVTQSTMGFQDPRYAPIVNNTWDAATKKRESTAIQTVDNRKGGRVLDYVLFKAPAGTSVKGANEYTAHRTDGADWLASDHRLVRLSLWLEAS